ncbi:MAG: hypothetical protein QXJ75_00310 [Candidatus Bathyarchaeia archaeon]
MSVRLEDLITDLAKERIVGSVKVTLACLGAIGGLSLNSPAATREDFVRSILNACNRLREVRPTLFLLQNGLQYVLDHLRSAFDRGADLEELKKVVSSSAGNFSNMVRDSVDRIGVVGSSYISDGDTILTHGCSTTVLSVISRAQQSGKRLEVITTETRPEFHGRLFAMAVADLGIPVTLIIDSAHRHVMGRVNKVLLGATAILLDGAVLGRIGTATVAHSAREAGVSVYVMASLCKICPDVKIVDNIRFEERETASILPPEEARSLGIKILNPVYDLTPPQDVSLLVTEDGAIPPSAVSSLVEKVHTLLQRPHA